ncbi:MAG: NifU family protein [Bacteroidia bacterium]
MIYTEITPNPSSLKFVVDTTFLTHGSADFPDVNSTTDAPLARKLFDFTFVDRVFIGTNFVTITKTDGFQWEELIPVIKDFLKAFFAQGIAPLTGKYTEMMQPVVDPEDDEVTAKIKSYLDSHVRPAVAGDGGDIIFDSFDEGVLKLRLQGSCSGCPSSTITLKRGIETLLTRMVPEVKSVEAV